MSRAFNVVRLSLAVLMLMTAAPTVVARQGPVPPPTSGGAAATSTPAAAYVVEQQYVRIRYENDGRARRELVMRLRMLTDQGARQWSTIPLIYASESEKLDLTKLEVRKAGGAIIPVAPDAVPEMAVQPAPEFAIFVDVRQKQVTVPALQAGDTIVLSAVWTTTKPLIPNHFWFTFSFTENAIVNDERLEIDAPAERLPVIRVREGAPAESSGGTGLQRGNRRLYRWQTSNAVAATEGAEESDEPPVADVRVTTFKDWDELGRWFAPRLNVAPDASIRAKARELTHGLSGRRERIEAIYEYVATQIRYVSLSFGIGRLVPHQPADVLKHQYGDCKDKHALLAALLAALDIEAHAALVSSVRSISDDFASPAEVNHAFTVVPDGDDPAAWIYLDSTVGVAPFQLLVPAIRDTRALVVDGSRPRLVTTPADPPFPLEDVIEIDGAVDGIGVLRAKVRVQARGATELLARSYVRATPPEALKEFVSGLVRGLQLSGEVSDIATSDPAAIRDPFEVTFQLRRRYLDWAAASSTVPLFAARFSVLSGARLTADVKRGTPMRAVVRSAIEFPEGYQVQAPVNVALERNGIEYRSQYESSNRRLVVHRTFSISARVLAAASSNEYAAVDRAMDADSAQQVTVRRTGLAIPAVPADATAAELYSAGYSAYATQQYEPALTFWKHAADKDPKMGDAWNGLSFAYLRLGRHDDAVAALQKQIALDAHDKRAYSDLGYVHREAGNKAAAADAYRRHTELNPLDGGALHRLGELYVDLGRHEEAVAALKKAASLGESDPWIPILTGAAYLQLKQNDKALAAFDRAIALADRPDVWTKIAWELAVHDLAPERVAELTARTITRAATAMEAVALDASPDDTLDLMNRLAWTWHARGLVQLASGNAAAAIRYSHAAWQLGGDPIVADHLGRAYEKDGRLADAVSHYVTAYAMMREPTNALRERIKRLAGGADLDKMVDTARHDYMASRSAIFKQPGVRGGAEYLAVIEPGKGLTALRMLSGDESMRAVEGALRKSTFPLELPEPAPARLLVKLLVACTDTHCQAAIAPHRNN